MAPTAGPLKLTTAGQTSTARLLYFDTKGELMPDGFSPPSLSFGTDDTTGAVAKIVDNGDNTATITAAADGTAHISASGTSAEGVAVSDEEEIDVETAPPPPPPPVLGSIKIVFDS